MSSEPKPNWKEKLEEIEVEMSNENTSINKQTFSKAIATTQNWFLMLPTVGKVLVSLFAVGIFFSLLSTVFSLLKLVFSLAILGVIGYVTYQFILKSNQEE